MSRASSAAKGLASLAAAVTNLVQASELAQDIREDTEHFFAPRWAKALLWLALVYLAAQETEKVRKRTSEVTR